jgi:phosphatidylserine/phosphatidylglycerophosphate/cardiolipin synthase-like enzyme
MEKTVNRKNLISKAGTTIICLAYSLTAACSGGVTGLLNNPASILKISNTGNPLLSNIATKVFERINNDKFTKVENGTIPRAAYLTFGNKFNSVYVDGTQIFPGFKEVISKAQKEVRLVSFEWNDKTDASRLIGEGLKIAQQNLPAGKKLSVKIMVDQVREQGNMVIRNLLTSRKNWNLDPAKVDLQLAVYPHIGLGANHSKYLVVDGQNVVLTGANVQDVHNFTPKIWHDTGYNIEGPVSYSILKDFEEAWTNHSKPIKCTDPESECASDPLPPSPGAPQAGENPPVVSGFPIIALTKTSKEFIGRDIDNPVDQGWLAAMENAQTYINIETPNINASGFQDAVIAAAKRGILVKVITGKGFNDASEGLPTQGGTNATIVKKLHERMTKEAFNLRGKLQLRWYSKKGDYPIDGGGANASHTKYMSVDGKVTIIGSGNMDTQSWKQSREFNFLLDEPTVTATIENAFFNSDWQKAIQIPY